MASNKINYLDDEGVMRTIKNYEIINLLTIPYDSDDELGKIICKDEVGNEANVPENVLILSVYKILILLGLFVIILWTIIFNHIYQTFSLNCQTTLIFNQNYQIFSLNCQNDIQALARTKKRRKRIEKLDISWQEKSFSLPDEKSYLQAQWK